MTTTFADPDSPNSINSMEDYPDSLAAEDAVDGQESADSGPVRPVGNYEETPNADRLVACYGNDMRYCTERKAYYVWDGRRWIWDDFRRVEAWAESTLNYEHAKADKIGNKRVRDATHNAITKACNRAPLQSMIHLAKKKVRTVSINDFDADPWILNCSNGIVLLKTGELLPHDRDALCSKLIPINYDPAAACPLFMKFLERIMGGGQAVPQDRRDEANELIDCLQRIFGCCATGNYEKTLIVLFGSGNNGKTTLLEVMRTVFGGSEYAGEVQINTLMAGSGQDNAISADIADLKGCRMVTSSEPEEGHHLSISRVKYLTGGSQIKARYLRENHFVFNPSHKILLDTNHPPVIQNADEAIWNRIRCIPFKVTIPRDQIDPDLPDKLRGESDGILAWAVAGSILYNEHGLYYPDVVLNATDEYRTKSDHIPVFISDACLSGPEYWVPVIELRRAYEVWAAECGEDKLTPNKFNDRLRKLSYKDVRKRPAKDQKQIRMWTGLKLSSAPKRARSLKPSSAV